MLSIPRLLSLSSCAWGWGCACGQPFPPPGAPPDKAVPVIVQMAVDFQGPFPFCIDAGTGPRVAVSPELADRLNLWSQGKPASPAGTAGAPVVRLSRVTVDGLSIENVDAAVLAAGAKPAGCEGVVGLSFFRGHVVTLDLRRPALPVVHEGAPAFAIARQALQPLPGTGGPPMTVQHHILGQEPGLQGRSLCINVPSPPAGAGVPFPPRFNFFFEDRPEADGPPAASPKPLPHEP